MGLGTAGFKPAADPERRVFNPLLSLSSVPVFSLIPPRGAQTLELLVFDRLALLRLAAFDFVHGAEEAAQ